MNRSTAVGQLKETSLGGVGAEISLSQVQLDHSFEKRLLSRNRAGNRSCCAISCESERNCLSLPAPTKTPGLKSQVSRISLFSPYLSSPGSAVKTSGFLF
jgi:hypothetical protein